MPVIGEPFGEVSPGFLPRTLDQLRRGVENDARRPENRLRRRRLTAEDERPEEPQHSLDAALDSLLAEVSDDETPHASGEVAPQAAEATQATSPLQEQAQEGSAPPSAWDGASWRSWGEQEREDWTPESHAMILAEAAQQTRARILAANRATARAAARDAARDTSRNAARDTARDAAGRLPLEIPSERRQMSRGEARLQRARERFARVFGTAEDIQQDDYESPLSTMYNRAYDRYNQAETRRATDTTSPPPLEGLSLQERRDIEEHILWGVMRESANQAEDNVWSYSPRRDVIDETPQSDLSTLRDFVGVADDSIMPLALPNSMPTVSFDTPAELHSTSVPHTHTASRESLLAVAANLRMAQARYQGLLAQRREQQSERLLAEPVQLDDPAEAATEPGQSAVPSSSAGGNGNGMTSIQTSIHQINSELRRLRLASEAITSARHSMHTHLQPEEPPQTLDNQPGRPSALSAEEMTMKLECQVCYQQLANIALLPCGHMVMCQWCADVVIPVKHTHLPIRPTKCPMCRKAVKQRFKIHMG
jgi:hypothetical protein